tara:strand:- start:373 stop:1296 length:924 start_codon:yes stop_codon:yes gene_type:complete
MKILITGGLGHLGGRLAVHLSKKGHQITLATKKEVSPPKWLPNCKVIQLNLSNEEQLTHAFSDIDQIIHAAGKNSADCSKDPVSALEVNALLTTKIAFAASKAFVKRFVYLSTIHVYSNNLEGIITEEDRTTNTHPYGTSKLAGEKALMGINSSSKMECLILRLSNLVGPPVHKNVNTWNLITNQICLKIIKKQKIILTKPFSRRDFLSISAFEEFISNSLEKKFQSPIINICSGKSFSISEISVFLQHIAIENYKYKKDHDNYHNNIKKNKNSFLKIESTNPYPITKNNLNNELKLLLDFCYEHFT